MMFYFFFPWTNFHYGFYFLYIYILILFLRPNAMVFEKPLLLWFCEFVHSWRKGSLFNTVCVGNDHIFLRKVYESKTIYTSMGVCVCVYICVVVVLKKKNYICEAIYLLVVKWLHLLLLFLDLKIWRNQTFLEGNCSLPLSLSLVRV